MAPGSLPGASWEPPGPFREASRGLSGTPCGGFSVALQRREYCKKCSPNRACMVSSWIPPHCPCFPHYFLGHCLVLYELMLGTLWNLQSQRAGFIVIASISPSLAPFPLHFFRWPLGFLWLPMDFHGFSSPHCAPHFFRWPFGFLWLPMDSNGCARHFFVVTWSPIDSRWIPTASDGFSSPHCAPHFLWRPFGFLGLPMDSYGFFPPHCSPPPRFFRWPLGFLWLPMDFNGFSSPNWAWSAQKSRRRPTRAEQVR